jgi:hypothetical protein
VKVKWWQVGLVVGVGWIVVRSWRPAWYDDLMLRAFAGDNLQDPGKTKQEIEAFEQAADLAARCVIPLGWALRIVEMVGPVRAEDAVKAVKAQVLAWGPPASTDAASLAAYKAKALQTVGVST